MASKTKKQVTSQDRISAGLDPWNHPKSLRDYLFDPGILTLTLKMVSSDVTLLEYARPLALGKVLSSSEVYNMACALKQSLFVTWTAFQSGEVLKVLGIEVKHPTDAELLIEKRLREINARYRKSIQMGLTTKPTIKEAMDALCDALRSDPDYRMGWQANIAVPFQDTCKKHKIGTRGKVHVASNEAANWFLDLLLMKPDEVGERDLADEIERSITSKAPIIVHTYTGNGEHTAVKVKNLKSLP